MAFFNGRGFFLDNVILDVAFRICRTAFRLLFYTFAFLVVAFTLACLLDPLLAIALLAPMATVIQAGCIFALGMAALYLADTFLTAIMGPRVTYIPIHVSYRPEIPASQAIVLHYEAMPQALHMPNVSRENLTERYDSTINILDRLKPGHGVEVIDDFKCSISHGIMSDPIAVTDSLNAIHYYERNQLRLYYQTEMRNGKRIHEITDPISRQPIAQLTPDEGLRQQIADYLQTLEEDFQAYLPSPRT